MFINIRCNPKRITKVNQEWRDFCINMWNMIFSEDKLQQYFNNETDVDDNSVGSRDTQAIFKVDQEGKDLGNMIRQFNRELKKQHTFDFNTALIPSPAKFSTGSPTANRISRGFKGTPKTVTKNLDRSLTKSRSPFSPSN